MLVKNRSTSSAGCPEKLIKSSNCAFRARANIDESAISSVVDIGVDFVRECILDFRDASSLITLYGINLALRFVIVDLAPVAVFLE